MEQKQWMLPPELHNGVVLQFWDNQEGTGSTMLDVLVIRLSASMFGRARLILTQSN